MAGSGSKTVVLSAVGGNTLITIAKFVGWVFSQSPSMLAEAIHSAADTFNQILLYIGIRQSRIGPTKMYPWGLRSAQYLWNLVSAVSVFFIGCGVTVYHGLHALWEQHGAHGGTLWLSLSILGAAFLVEGYVFVIAVREFNHQRGRKPVFEFLQTSDDPTTLAVLFEDGIALLGVVLAIAGIVIADLTGSHLPDAVASLVIGVMLGVMAIALATLNGRYLLGMATTPAREAEIRAFLSSLPQVEHVVALKTRVYGPGQLRLSCELELHGSGVTDRQALERDIESIRGGADPGPVLFRAVERTVRLVGHEINQLEDALKSQFPEIFSISIEIN